MSRTSSETDVCVIGGGMIGLSTALAVAKSGNTVALCAPKALQIDTRTTALLSGTVEFFKELEIWQHFKDPFPLKVMRIVDGTNRLFRSPQTDFNSSEIDQDAFGYNLRNADIMRTLEEHVAENDKIRRVVGLVEKIESEGPKEKVFVRSGKRIDVQHTSFLVGADGRNSIVRKLKNIGEKDWSYPQTAIVLDFDHEISSHFTSTEFHTESGPFTIVPQSNHRAGLVWMERPERAEQIIALEPAELGDLLEQKMQSFLGKVMVIGAPQSFPISGMMAKRFGEKNHALVGEAAHAFPPIGAQGFNLGVRDIQAVVEVLARHTANEDRGSAYHQLRFSDIQSRTIGVDLLNRSLISDFLPLQIARSLGLQILGTIDPVRKQVMKMGISPH